MARMNRPTPLLLGRPVVFLSVHGAEMLDVQK